MRTVLALILVLVVSPAMAQSPDGSRAGKILSPYFFVDGAKPGVESFPLKSTAVVANISGVETILHDARFALRALRKNVVRGNGRLLIKTGVICAYANRFRYRTPARSQQ